MRPTVSFSFDDGIESVFLKGFPILEKYGFVGTVFIITEKIGQDGFLSENQISRLVDAGWEVGSHTVSHLPIIGRTETEMRVEFNESKKRLKDISPKSENVGEGLAFPHGGPDAVSKREIARASQDYCYTRLNANRTGRYAAHSVEAVVNVEPINPYVLLGRNPYFGGIRDFQLNVNEAIARRGWYIFYTHGLGKNSAPNINEFASMVNLCNHLKETGEIEVVPIITALKNCTKSNMQPSEIEGESAYKTWVSISPSTPATRVDGLARHAWRYVSSVL